MNFTHLDTKDIETTESFFFDQFLSARIYSGTESNEGYDPIFELGRDDDWPDRNWAAIKENDMKYDEDVNQYITLTLAELAGKSKLQ